MAVPPRSTPATTGTLFLLCSLMFARPRLAEFWRAFPENDDFEKFCEALSAALGSEESCVQPADTLQIEMSSPFCNVALPVPLRTTFTYAIPEALREAIQPGSRVLVPFRKKSLIGVVVEMAERPPANAKLREITKVMEFAPALTPKLIELAQWIANYYLAPIGEVFRAMLPPVTELNLRREIILTGAGRGAAESLGGGEISHGLSAAEAAFLEKANAQKGPVLFSFAVKMGMSSAG